MNDGIAIAENPNYAAEAQELSKNLILRAMVVDLIENVGYDDARTILVDRGQGLEDTSVFRDFHSFQMAARETAHKSGVVGSYIGAVVRAMGLIIQEDADFEAKGAELADQARDILDLYTPLDLAHAGIVSKDDEDELFIDESKIQRSMTMHAIMRFARIIGASIGGDLEHGADPMAVRWTIKSELKLLRERISA